MYICFNPGVGEQLVRSSAAFAAGGDGAVRRDLGGSGEWAADHGVLPGGQEPQPHSLRRGGRALGGRAAAGDAVDLRPASLVLYLFFYIHHLCFVAHDSCIVRSQISPLSS